MLFGHHVVAELKDLVSAKDFVIAKTEAFRATVAAPDASWDADWAAFKARYAKAHASAMVKILAFDSAFTQAMSLGQAGVRSSVVPCEDEYQGILTALTRIAGSLSKGDYQELYNRIDPTGKAIDFSKMPQPTAVDADLNVLNGATVATNTMDDIAAAALKKAKEAAKPVVPFIAGGAIFAGLAGIATVFVGVKYGIPVAQKMGYLPTPHHKQIADGGDHDFDE